MQAFCVTTRQGAEYRHILALLRPFHPPLEPMLLSWPGEIHPGLPRDTQAGASCCNRSFESVAAGQCLRRVLHGKLTICTSSGSRKLRGGKCGSCRAALTALRRTLAARSSIATREPMQPRSACFFVKVTKTARVF